MLDLVDRGWSRLAGLRDTSFALIPSRPRHSVEEHDRIVELIRTGADPDELELFTRNHRLRTLDAFLQAQLDATEFIHEKPLEAAQIVADGSGLPAEVVYLYNGPGGTDFKYAEKQGIKALLAPGLPGIVAPKTAGQIINKGYLC